MQMVVVPAMSTRATTDMAKVSFTVLPKGSRQNGQVNPVSGSIGAVPRSGYTCD
ncbi:hypothetical protein FHX57_000130 [Paraburkholderia tropica]|nr:hypothetical protein [Paraburkholderia tropica]MBB2997817.1 hypothetical protein [Paraburkholderia tropica]MBB6316839.1 hypothetical protein [Paraburkholderia tropica]